MVDLGGNTSALFLSHGTLNYVGFAMVIAIELIAILVLLFAHKRIASVNPAILNAKAAVERSDGEARFRMLAEAIPHIVWTAVPGGGIDYVNQRWHKLTGFTDEQTLGWGWREGLHPDDQPLALQSWEKAHQTGESFETEYRIQSVTGGYRWHLVRANPMRDSSGQIVKWFGACADIDDQMRHQQLLEDQVKQHTAALMDANTRLSSEMHERALAQQELNEQSERTVQELTKRSNRATALIQMAELLQSCASIKDAFPVIAGMAPKIFPKLCGVLLLFQSSHEILDVAAIWSDCELPSHSVGLQDCWGLRAGRPHLVTAGDYAAECGHAARCQHSYLCLPLLSNGVATGLLHFQMIEPGEIPQPVLLFANMFAEQIRLSLANIELREALRSQSIRDALTGLYNRGYLDEILERETKRAVRATQDLGLIMLDLDHFKNFNDTYGHDAGDSVLRETAAFLLKSVRSEDFVCRFGGEEFIVILPAADLKTTCARAERIRSKLRELNIVHRGQPLGMITVSAGVAGAPLHGASPKDLIEAADAALYRAKRAGRDRVLMADSVPADSPQPMSGAMPAPFHSI